MAVYSIEYSRGAFARRLERLAADPEPALLDAAAAIRAVFDARPENHSAPASAPSFVTSSRKCSPRCSKSRYWS